MLAWVALVIASFALAIAVYAAVLSTRVADRVVSTAVTAAATATVIASDPDRIQQMHRELSKMEEFFGESSKKKG